MKVLEYAEKSLEKVLNFYESRGITLSYHPKLIYVDEVFPEMPQIAAIKDELVPILFFPKELIKIIWYEFYEIRLSNDAVDDLIKAIEDKIPYSNTRPTDEKKIVLFKPFKKYINISDEIIAHEVWHLIEIERGVFYKHSLIAEGTATYAMIEFVGKEYSFSGKCENLITMLYNGAANIVKKYVENSRNPLKEMLNEKIRNEIQHELIGTIKSFLTQRKNIELKEIKSVLEKFPEFGELFKEPTPKKIISFYEKIGARKFADELRNQNLEKLIEYYRKIL